MKYMTGKAKMMVTGIALGTVAAGGMAALIAAGKVGVICQEWMFIRHQIKERS